MKRVGLVKTCMISALLSSAAWAVPGMQAQAADIPLKAPAADESPALWWFHGDVEAGGRFFLNDPNRNGSAYLGQQSLAKFYEYRDLRPGPFGNFWVATGTKDGLYQVDVTGKNVGYRDQQFTLDASKAGEHYFNFIWDQSPHLYSTSAQTFYQGLGTSVLGLPPGMQGVGGFGNLIYNNTAGQAISPFLYTTDLGIKRDTAAADYRWTPTDAWDIRADYSHMDRTGTQIEGIVGFGRVQGGNSTPIQVPKPVDDTTQNYGVNGEYAGTSPWGQKMTVKVGYVGSTFTENLGTSWFVQNPYTSASQTTVGLSPFAMMATWPSNNMNGFSSTVGADLPWKSRYVGTVSYTMMRQDESFQPMSYQNQTFGLPASSLNGAINTTLSNNIVTTQITPELTNKLTYRYYNYDNQTPQLVFPSWISLDRAAANETAVTALVMSYVKQNAGEELVWRPTRQWTVGGAYGFERYDWTNYIASATNESSFKLFADWRPASWATLRSSGYYANRRAEDYNVQAFSSNQWVNSGFRINPAYQILMVDNRERWKANVALDVLVAPGLTLTPTFKYQDDSYGINPATQYGLTDARSWNAGADLTYVIDPRTSVMVGYEREFLTQLVYGATSGSSTATPTFATSTMTNDRIVVDTFTGLLRYAAIPDKLDTELRYTASRGVDTQNLFNAGAVPASGQFPDVRSWFQRVDATATYTFDKTQIAALGWKGEVKAKLHYAWERNSVNNWQQDPLMPTGNTGEPSVIYMAYDNPNYNVHLLAASLLFKW